MTDPTICIHGHFYQPPREDPLTGIIPIEMGAVPFNNWNEKIHSECYRPNAELRNFSRVSFNIGPTLLNWLASYDPDTLEKIIDQDHENYAKYGVGNALAQPFNHTILPLASYRDKVTQVRWGITDFEFRFGRKPQGMWLPETAIDTETLLVLSDAGIEFTILAPWQAHANRLDPTEPYIVSLPGKRQIIAFFYHGELSSKISFEPGATLNADHFVTNEVVPHLNPIKKKSGEPQLMLLASDGELYGHHKPQRQLFLKHLVNGASSGLNIQITFPALWLKHHPPRRKIQLRYQTSWSCHHGIRRWETGCPCTPGDSSWKGHMRQALNKLAAALDNLYYEQVSRIVPEPWELRNRYIDVLLGKTSLAQLLSEFSPNSHSFDTIQRMHWLLESQFERQRMFTSCGWFFEDFDRIEPRNNIAYAAQAVWMAYQATGLDLTAKASEWLKIISSRSGDIRADQVFLKHLLRAQTSRQNMPIH